MPIKKWIITGKDPRIGLVTEQPDKLRNSENPFKDFLFLVCKGSGDRSHTPPQVKSTNSQGWLAGMHYQIYRMQNHLGDRPLWGSKFLMLFISTWWTAVGRLTVKGRHTLPGLAFQTALGEKDLGGRIHVSLLPDGSCSMTSWFFHRNVPSVTDLTTPVEQAKNKPSTFKLLLEKSNEYK